MSFVRLFQLLAQGKILTYGVGTPETFVKAPIGALYVNRTGGAGATLWVKEAGNGLATGWVAK